MTKSHHSKITTFIYGYFLNHQLIHHLHALFGKCQRQVPQEYRHRFQKQMNVLLVVLLVLFGSDAERVVDEPLVCQLLEGFY
jgi:hypothetical protein